jgi:hypothetical protein
MSKLNELIDKQIHDIQFNGCTLPESILRKQFEVIVSLAKLEESMEANQRYLDSIGTAFGNGANDKPNVIGQHITEPEQVGRWYKYLGGLDSDFNVGDWYFCHTGNPLGKLAFIDKYGEPNGFSIRNPQKFDLTNPQLNNPDRTDLNFIDPITN